MGIECQKDRVIFSDFVTVEDAEELLAWLQGYPQATLDLSCCKHLHAAPLQLLMIARPRISAWPEEPGLADWLQQILKTDE